MPQEKVVIAKGNGTIENMFSNGNTIKFTAHTNEKNIIQINTVYFPGWKAMIDNKEQTILYDNPSGVMQIPLQKGTHTITAKFTETTERLISDMISIISFIGVSILFFLEKRKYGKV